jgi:hypothetical protein
MSLLGKQENNVNTEKRYTKRGKRIGGRDEIVEFIYTSSFDFIFYVSMTKFILDTFPSLYERLVVNFKAAPRRGKYDFFDFQGKQFHPICARDIESILLFGVFTNADPKFLEGKRKEETIEQSERESIMQFYISYRTRSLSTEPENP